DCDCGLTDSHRHLAELRELAWSGPPLRIDLLSKSDGIFQSSLPLANQSQCLDRRQPSRILSDDLLEKWNGLLPILAASVVQTEICLHVLRIRIDRLRLLKRRHRLGIVTEGRLRGRETERGIEIVRIS